GSYHGKTIGALSITDAPIFKQPFGRLLSNVQKVSRVDSVAVSEKIRTEKPAAFFIEPIQGEGGIYEFESSYIQEISKACNDVGTLLVFDEIQSGLGRTGTFWASEIFDVKPDIVIAGKALGAGIIPVSALIATEKTFKPFDRDPILHSSTFSGNPLASVAMLESLKLILDCNVPNLSKWKGEKLSAIINSIINDFPEIYEKRTGRGLLQGIHCQSAEISGLLVVYCLEEGLILTPCLSTPKVVRLSPSAFVSDEELNMSSQILDVVSKKIIQEIKLRKC
ncbi:aspartate aminotransferase family protein, partial [Leptospira interrogans]